MLRPRPFDLVAPGLEGLAFEGLQEERAGGVEHGEHAHALLGRAQDDLVARFHGPRLRSVGFNLFPLHDARARVSLYIPLLLGTVRDERKSEWVAQAVLERIRAREGAESRLFDPRELPFGNLVHREWEMRERPPAVDEFVREMARADGFLVVSPEYNYGYPGTLKNMLDAVYDEWNRKPFAIVGVGGISGGLRMIEHLRAVVAGLGAVSVPHSVPVQFVGKTWGPQGPTDGVDWAPRFDKLLDELLWYAKALKAARG